jgi:hypothetical protein
MLLSSHHMNTLTNANVFLHRNESTQQLHHVYQLFASLFTSDSSGSSMTQLRDLSLTHRAVRSIAVDIDSLSTIHWHIPPCIQRLRVPYLPHLHAQQLAHASSNGSHDTGAACQQHKSVVQSITVDRCSPSSLVRLLSNHSFHVKSLTIHEMILPPATATTTTAQVDALLTSTKPTTIGIRSLECHDTHMHGDSKDDGGGDGARYVPHIVPIIALMCGTSLTHLNITTRFPSWYV